MTHDEAREEAGKLLAALSDIGGAAKGIHGGFSGLLRAAEAIVPKVEALGVKLKLSGEHKKAVAVEAILIMLRRYAPAWLVVVPDFVLRWLIGLAVEKVVSLMNKRMKGNG